MIQKFFLCLWGILVCQFSLAEDDGFPPELSRGYVFIEEQGVLQFERFFKDTTITEESHFPIASVSKQMTAFAMGLLIDSGLFRENMDLKEVLSELDGTRLGDVTIRELLDNRSSIIDAGSSSSVVGQNECFDGNTQFRFGDELGYPAEVYKESTRFF
jgi:CubicO group peptidase (beta-lactamase class C family)